MTKDNSLRQHRLELTKKNLPLALLIFIIPMAGYICFLHFFTSHRLAFCIIFSLLVAWFTGMLFIVGHDAGHQSFTSFRIINNLIVRIAFLPSLHSFSLWDLGHNKRHHKYNNVRGIDYVWEPMSPMILPDHHPQNVSCIGLSRSIIGIPFVYAFQIWLPKMFLLRKSVYGKPFGHTSVIVY